MKRRQDHRDEEKQKSVMMKGLKKLDYKILQDKTEKCNQRETDRQADREVYLGGGWLLWAQSPPSVSGPPGPWRPRCRPHSRLHARATQAVPEWRAGLGTEQSRNHSRKTRVRHGWTTGTEGRWKNRQQRYGGVRGRGEWGRGRLVSRNKWGRRIKNVIEREEIDVEQDGCLWKIESSSSHVECTCARSIISGVYFDGVSGVGALLGHVSVSRAFQAAVTHSVQVAAICPKTTRH